MPLNQPLMVRGVVFQVASKGELLLTAPIECVERLSQIAKAEPLARHVATLRERFDDLLRRLVEDPDL
jgi:hypothetical protein